MSQVHFIDRSIRDAQRDKTRELRREAAKNSKIQEQATLLHDQADLDQLLDGADPTMRTAMIEYLKPYLSFVPVDVPEPEAPIADCPNCGLRRGSAILHPCTPQ